MTQAHSESRPLFGSMRPLINQHWKTFLTVFTLAFLGALVFAFAQTPQFAASARLIIETRNNAMLPTEAVLSGQPSREADLVDTEVEALHSPELLRRVVDELQLQVDSEFSNRSEDGNAAAAKLLDHLKIYRAGKTYIVDVIARSADPAMAAQIANSVVKTHLAMQMETKRNANREANKLLLERIDEMSADVEQAENAVQGFKIANGLMSVDGATLAEQSIASIENDLARARATEGAAFGALGAANNSGTRFAAANTPALEQLVVQQAAAEQKWQQAREVYGRQHPQYQEAKLRIDQLRIAIAGETRRARSALSAHRQQRLDALRASAQAAAQKRASLSRSVGHTRKALLSNNRAQVKLNILERKAEAVRANYEAYLGRYQETTAQIGTEQPDARILSSATTPTEPAGPDRLLIILIGTLFALAMAVSVVTALHMRRRSIDAPD